MKNSPLNVGLAMLCPVTSDTPLRTVAERDLLIYIRSRVLRRLTIVETGGGLYRLRVSLTVERHDFVLASSRGLPREWSSLDSLAKQIRCKYGSSASVALSLTNPPTLSVERCGVESGPEPQASKCPPATRSTRGTRPQELAQ